MAAQVSSTDGPEVGRNPVDRVLAEARRVGSEYCWALPRAADVVGALGELEQAVLGFELWAFDDGLKPRVVGFSEYRLELDRPWTEVVDESVRLALAGLSGQGDPSIWANLTWMSEREAVRYRPGFRDEAGAT